MPERAVAAAGAGGFLLIGAASPTRGDGNGDAARGAHGPLISGARWLRRLPSRLRRAVWPDSDWCCATVRRPGMWTVPFARSWPPAGSSDCSWPATSSSIGMRTRSSPDEQQPPLGLKGKLDGRAQAADPDGRAAGVSTSWPPSSRRRARSSGPPRPTPQLAADPGRRGSRAARPADQADHPRYAARGRHGAHPPRRPARSRCAPASRTRSRSPRSGSSRT